MAAVYKRAGYGIPGDVNKPVAGLSTRGPGPIPRVDKPPVLPKEPLEWFIHQVAFP